jgi:hypothetical protein
MDRTVHRAVGKALRLHTWVAGGALALKHGFLGANRIHSKAKRFETVGYRRSVEPIPETVEAVAELDAYLDDGRLLERLIDSGDCVRDIVPDCVGLSVAYLDEGIVFTPSSRPVSRSPSSTPSNT